MGVGLSICRAHHHPYGGELWFDNEPALGAAFHFKLPLAPDMN
jgi:signal transduction histidine kinase